MSIELFAAGWAIGAATMFFYMGHALLIRSRPEWQAARAERYRCDAGNAEYHQRCELPRGHEGPHTETVFSGPGRGLYMVEVLEDGSWCVTSKGSPYQSRAAAMLKSFHLHNEGVQAKVTRYVPHDDADSGG